MARALVYSTSLNNLFFHQSLVLHLTPLQVIPALFPSSPKGSGGVEALDRTLVGDATQRVQTSTPNVEIVGVSFDE